MPYFASSGTSHGAQPWTGNAGSLAQIKVLTSFTVFADMARNVAGEHAEVVSITREGAEIHMFRPTPG
jgi:manganese/iron transport system substrate-binding protein